jgi:hypothetical protein
MPSPRAAQAFEAGTGQDAGGPDANVEQDDRPRNFLGTGLSEDHILHRLRYATVRRFRPVGSSSVVFRMSLHGGVDGAFKPPSRHREHADAAEVAAYRLARVLGLDNVPPVITRRFMRTALQHLLHPDFVASWSKLNDRVAWDGDGGTRGAAIYWVPDMKEAVVEAPAGVSSWLDWLQSPAGPPESGRVLAADLSTMLAFDYLIGNWDRFSGANIHTDGEARRLIARDHDVAFPARLPENVHRRILERVLRVRKFSRRFIASVTALDADALRASLAENPGSKLDPWLDDLRVGGVMDRRETLLSHVSALMREHGGHSVLAFP